MDGSLCFMSVTSSASIFSLETRSIQQWDRHLPTIMHESEGNAFPPFCLFSWVLQKLQIDKATKILVSLAWQAQPWHSKVLEMNIRNPILISKLANLLFDPNSQKHSHVISRTLQLMTWVASREKILQKD